MDSRARTALLALALALGPAAGCDGAGAERRPPNVILVSIDTLRADHLGCYGYARQTSPTIDRLAREGVLFEKALSSASWTLPAHASMFTGLAPSAHGCTGRTGLPEERVTLAETLRASGYETAAFWSGPFLDPHFLLNQGFDEYISCVSYVTEQPEEVETLSHVDITNPKLVREVSAWLRKEHEEPFFLFIHMWDVHHDFIPPKPFDDLFDADYSGPVDGKPPKERHMEAADLQHLIALYDGEIAWTDSSLGEIVAVLEGSSLLDSSILVITADHGEEFFEHGLFGHRQALFEESIHVPLILRYPPALPRGRRVRAGVSTTDLPATLLDLLGRPSLPDAQGKSFLPLLSDPALEPRPTISELGRNGRHWIGIRTDRWKALIDRETGEVSGWWNLVDDPEEEHNLAGKGLPEEIRVVVEREHKDLLAQRERLQTKTLEDTPLPAPLENTLRHLGYVDEEE